RFPVALGIRAAEIALEVFLEVAAFLMADDDALFVPDRGEAAGHRAVLGKEPVAVQLDEITERKLDIIERKWPRRVPGNLDALPRGEVFVNHALCFFDFALHSADFG